MNKLITTLLLILMVNTTTFAQNMSAIVQPVATQIEANNHLSSSILLWMRDDKPRQTSMDRWKGAHAQIIAANPGLYEYRQIHFAQNNNGLWTAIAGVETAIPQARKIDGVADVTLKGYLSILQGAEQNKQAFADEVNIFKRTILYAALPNGSRWYDVAQPNQTVGARSMVFFRIKDGVKTADFKNFIHKELTPALANTGVLQELRSKTYMSWRQSQWNTPNVLHDNPQDAQFQASLILGFVDKDAMAAFFASDAVTKMSDRISVFCTAVHAYEVAETLTFVAPQK